MKKGESLKKILISIFKRKGGEGERTFLFDNLSPENKNLISNTLSEVNENEYTVLVYLKDVDNHFIITTDRIIEKKDGRKLYFSYAELNLASTNLSVQYKLGIKSKKEFNVITLKFDNTEYNLIVEPENPYWGLLNVLRYLAFNYPKTVKDSS